MSPVFIIHPAPAASAEQAIAAIHDHNPVLVNAVGERLILATMSDKDAKNAGQDPRIGAVEKSRVQPSDTQYSRCPLGK